MRALNFLPLLVASAAAAIPYQQYILAPSSRTIRPVSIFRQHGSISSPNGLLEHSSGGKGLVLNALNASVTYDFGKNIGGLVNFDLTSHAGSVGVTFSESSLWVSPQACDATADSGLDTVLVFNISKSGHYEAPPEKERGAFRYLTVVNLGNSKVEFKDLWVQFTAMPHWEDNALRDYTGWFHSIDEQLNRVWYAGAYTNQLVTINPKRGDSLLGGDWHLNTTITNGTSVLTDGAKRDRLVWSGDMAIAVPGIAVTTFDLISIRNALDSLFGLQAANGQLPYAGFPFNERGLVSFTYHLYALIGVANFYLWSDDKAFLDAKWPAWKLAMQWATQQIDASGLANVTAPNDWLRFGMGGHNIEANAILFYTLSLGAGLAHDEGDAATASTYAALASTIQQAAVPLLWQPAVGLFRDNETTTLAPQDGNAWAIKSGLLAPSSNYSTAISAALQSRWGAFGAPAPEAADAISPFISGFELEAHFMARRPAAALALIRGMWADFMLDDPRMTNSTFIEGYSTSGALHYAPYANDARISHAHGWATGPTSALTTFVGGIQILSGAGATWTIAPQPGDLTAVDTGFSTPKGAFTSKWTRTKSTFTLTISTPAGTTGSVGIPLPAGAQSSARLTGGPGGNSKAATTVRGDDAGVYWIEDLPGGSYVFVATGV